MTTVAKETTMELTVVSPAQRTTLERNIRIRGQEVTERDAFNIEKTLLCIRTPNVMKKKGITSIKMRPLDQQPK
jgi:hypothetical protein